MSWKSLIKGYENYLKIEKSLSVNTVDAYVRDINKMDDFFNAEDSKKKMNSINHEDFQNYLLKKGYDVVGYGLKLCNELGSFNNYYKKLIY